VSIFFIDISALAKRYLLETGATWMRSLLQRIAGNTIFVAQITGVETVSAISCSQRRGEITLRTARAARLMVDRHMQREYRIIPLTSPVISHAEDLLEAHPLRAADAIQLASAIEINLRLVQAGQPALTFVSADTRLLTIAAAEGLTTDDPNQHP
jgi:uncharacterized protein